ncbi:MAG: oxygen-independent coproporphyrinogen III oxidase [Pseudohongiellaceae bacterium]|nr:oxygen-independent coproporphyrinogen III oxidase [Pseudohongiellaceae bacterium]
MSAVSPLILEDIPNTAGLSAELLRRYQAACPRYTSYPTADRFHDLDPSLDKPWENLASVRDLSLYVHLPFCRSLCYFCACNKVVTREYALAANYLEYVIKEAKLYKDRLHNATVTQFHIGGGTPNFLRNEDLSRLVGALDEVFDLKNVGQRDYSIELDPRGLEIDTLETLRELGFNRLSFGVQDFNDDVQHAVNRICSKEQLDTLVKAARKLGFESISFDLILGLPLQTLETLKHTIEEVIGMKPDRIALYHYAHLPQRFKAQRLIEANIVPNTTEKILMMSAAVEQLDKAGYQSIGMDHFALPDDSLAKAANSGQLHRNFQGYTTLPADALIGIGASAISYTGAGYWQNHRRLPAYYKALDSSSCAVERMRLLTEDDKVRQRVIMDLMCSQKLDKDEVSANFNIDFDGYFATEIERLTPLVEDGLVLINKTSIQITEKGHWFNRQVATVFDKYLSADQNNAIYSKTF